MLTVRYEDQGLDGSSIKQQRGQGAPFPDAHESAHACSSTCLLQYMARLSLLFRALAGHVAAYQHPGPPLLVTGQHAWCTRHSGASAPYADAAVVLVMSTRTPKPDPPPTPPALVCPLISLTPT
mmetsp:Transcript_24635/g.53802  ORF Transcript_24635/g.53802 Transcript_24635/m.53802 type:complete len:124 (+) Transcript_24635:180-551(+)